MNRQASNGEYATIAKWSRSNRKSTGEQPVFEWEEHAQRNKEDEQDEEGKKETPKKTEENGKDEEQERFNEKLYLRPNSFVYDFINIMYLLEHTHAAHRQTYRQKNAHFYAYNRSDEIQYW